MPITLIAMAVALISVLPRPAFAQSVYFKGKTISVYVAFGAGGGYDQYARLLVRHIGKHVPGNPAVVASNMPGANGLVAANYLYNVAPKDGTALGFLYQNIAQDQMLGGPGIRYDASKFNWIGRITSNTEILYTWHSVPIKSVHDLTQRETILAAGSPGIAIYANLLSVAVGARFKLVHGYPGTQGVHLALERGEVEGAVSSLNTIRSLWGHWLKDRKINIIVQSVLHRHPQLPEVPTIVELGKSPEERSTISFFAASGEIGRSVTAPPDVPADQLDILRTAFEATMKDEQFLAEAQQMKMDIEPLAWNELSNVSDRIVSIGAGERERVRAVPTR